jgi:L-seryl-tRNA(Ser) seleniumtransferase
MITTASEDLEETAEMIARELESLVGNEADVSVEPGVGRVGGGALPLGDLPGPRVAVRPRNISTARLAQKLRSGQPPLITVVKEDAIFVDPRTLLHDQAQLVPRVLAAAFDATEP